jgi:hypothetical protein
MLLFRKKSAPELSIDSEDLSPIANLKLEDYEMPFNTVMPMSEFDTMSQLNEHYNEQLQALDNKNYPDYKRRIVSPFDLLISRYKEPVDRWGFLVLLPRLNDKDWADLCRAMTIEPCLDRGPGLFANRYNTITLEPRNEEYALELYAKYDPIRNN